MPDPPLVKVRRLLAGQCIIHHGEVVRVERVFPAGLIAAGNGRMRSGHFIDWHAPDDVLPDGMHRRIGCMVLPSDSHVQLAGH